MELVAQDGGNPENDADQANQHWRPELGLLMPSVCPYIWRNRLLFKESKPTELAKTLYRHAKLRSGYDHQPKAPVDQGLIRYAHLLRLCLDSSEHHTRDAKSNAFRPG